MNFTIIAPILESEAGNYPGEFLLEISCPVSFFRPLSQHFHYFHHSPTQVISSRNLPGFTLAPANTPFFTHQGASIHQVIRSESESVRSSQSPEHPVRPLPPRAIHSPYPSRKAYAFFRSIFPSFRAKDRIARPTSWSRKPY